MCRNVMVRKEQKRALGESEERFSKLFLLLPVALSLSTLDTASGQKEEMVPVV